MRSDAARSRTNARLERVSGSARIIELTPPSRRLSDIRRSSSWPSRGRVSISTPVRRPRALRSRSHARMSPAFGNGTSDRTATDSWSRDRNRCATSAWARSRSGEPPGYARTESSSPTMALTRANMTTLAFGIEPPSSLEIVVCATPAALPTSLCDSPAATRARRISSPRSRTILDPARAPRSTARSRAGIRSRLEATAYLAIGSNSLGALCAKRSFATYESSCTAAGTCSWRETCRSCAPGAQKATARGCRRCGRVARTLALVANERHVHNAAPHDAGSGRE